MTRYFFGASMLKTSLRTVARTFGSQPRADHLSRRTWAAVAMLSSEMSFRQESLQSRSAVLNWGTRTAGAAKDTGFHMVIRFSRRDLPQNLHLTSACFLNSLQCHTLARKSSGNRPKSTPCEPAGEPFPGRFPG